MWQRVGDENEGGSGEANDEKHRGNGDDDSGECDGGEASQGNFI